MSHNKRDDSHLFSLYLPEIEAAFDGKKIVLREKNIVHRIVRVLRIKTGQSCIFFTKTMNYRCTVLSIQDKKTVTLSVDEKEKNKVFAPSITFLLPLLKKEHFETALYSMVELGATTVQLVLTSKVHRRIFGKKEFERSKAIIIGAAEQSKNFSFPEIKMPISLDDALLSVDDNARKVLFDVDGDPVEQFFSQDKKVKKQIVLLIGPEGDLSDEEKKKVISSGFQRYSLTDTVLRSVQAATLSLGIVRSFLRQKR